MILSDKNPATIPCRTAPHKGAAVIEHEPESRRKLPFLKDWVRIIWNGCGHLQVGRSILEVGFNPACAAFNTGPTTSVNGTRRSNHLRADLRGFLPIVPRRSHLYES